MKRYCLLAVAAFALLWAGGTWLDAAEPAETPPPTVATELFELPGPARPAGKIDELVFARLEKLGIEPRLCSDAVFLRRAYLDVIGTLPTAEEARAFLDNPDTANKRRELIEQLLQREEFADHWAMRWGDVLRIKAEFPVNLWPNAAQAYHRYVRASLADNKPYDQFARELLTSSGSNFRVAPVNFYRAIQDRTPQGIAAAVALTFMGARTETWPPERLAGMAVFFSQVGYKPTSEWKEQIVFWDPLGAASLPGNVVPGRDAPGTGQPKPAEGQGEEAPPALPSVPSGPIKAVFPDGTAIELPPDRDPRQVFAEWLIRPENPWFTRAIVNRVWAWLLGRGIIHEADDIRDDNPPSNPELLAYLEKELIASGYDLKHLYRLILNSHTYQMSAVPAGGSEQAEAQFARYPIRRLEAEVLIDAINVVTGTWDFYSSPIPEPFTFIPPDVRAVALGDGSITSQFLALFGRSPRATGAMNERDNKPVPAQFLHMLNSSHIQRKLAEGAKLKALFEADRPVEEVVEELYLMALSRRPTAEELKTAMEHIQANRVKREGMMDIAWALLNSTEFLYRH